MEFLVLQNPIFDYSANLATTHLNQIGRNFRDLVHETNQFVTM